MVAKKSDEYNVEKDTDLVIDKDVIKYIIKNYTDNEEGVRNLKRCIEIIFTKLNWISKIAHIPKIQIQLISIGRKVINANSNLP